MGNCVRIAMVEDQEESRSRLRGCLKKYEQENQVEIRLTEFSDGEDLLEKYSADYDVILMDILMPFIDGMETAKRVRAMDPSVVIIFITSTPQYAIEGYKVGAVDYILKPISWFSFQESLTRALRLHAPKEKNYIRIALKGGQTRLEVDRICYVEIQDHQLIYNTLDGRYVTKGPIREAEQVLTQEAGFYRCNRCYLVNMRHVENYAGFDIRVGGDVIQVSRSRRKGFLDALNAWMNGAGQ